MLQVQFKTKTEILRISSLICLSLLSLFALYSFCSLNVVFLTQDPQNSKSFPVKTGFSKVSFKTGFTVFWEK